MLASDEKRAWYGPDHVALASDRGAIGTLMISDELFKLAQLAISYEHSLDLDSRSSVPEVRKKYVGIVEDVQQKGAEVLIFSSMHESGQRTRYSPSDAYRTADTGWITMQS